MRSGDFAVEVVTSNDRGVRELESGHVLARAGTVYRLRLRNFGPLYCVADISIDGRRVTGGGLVLRPWSTMDLERPVDEDEDGCFTVAAEGDEAALGPDGGRDNDELGLIDARFRRELPGGRAHTEMPPTLTSSYPSPMWTAPVHERGPRHPASIESLLAPRFPGVHRVTDAEIERAAGTGLTGHSDQRFMPMALGPLETEATVIKLRLVIASETAIADAPAQPTERAAPARPAARP
jgi:hypothetical protein